MLTPARPSSTGPCTGYLDATPAGQYEFARVLSVSGAQVALTQPLAQGFIERSQAVVVPEFRSAVVDGTVSAPAWNGSSGGIVAMLVAGELKGTGTIAASGAGFRPPPPLRSDGQPCLSSWVIVVLGHVGGDTPPSIEECSVSRDRPRKSSVDICKKSTWTPETGVFAETRAYGAKLNEGQMPAARQDDSASTASTSTTQRRRAAVTPAA
jgi:hypothetical protein